MFMQGGWDFGWTLLDEWSEWRRVEAMYTCVQIVHVCFLSSPSGKVAERIR